MMKEEQSLPILSGYFRFRKYRNVTGYKITEEGILIHGDLVEVVKQQNTFTTLGKQLTLKLLGRKIGVTGLEYIAIGEGAAASSTLLDDESARAAITFTSTITGAVVIMTFSALFEPDVPGGDITISEIGIFGNGATSVEDTGHILASNGVAPTIFKETGTDILVADYILQYV